MGIKEELKEDNNNSLVDSISKFVPIRGDRRKEFNKIKDGIQKDVRPEGAIEQLMCSKIIADNWRLIRFYDLESQILRRQQEACGKPEENMWTGPKKREKRFRSTNKQIRFTKNLEEIQKQMSILEASILKTTTEIKRIQRERIQNQK